MDKAGQWVVPPRFSFARAFSNGLAPVTEGRRSGWIDRQGRYVWQENP